MSTRSTISAIINNEIQEVYCHHDGYPDSQMPILTVHYNTQEKAEELISGGGMSSLYEKIEDVLYYTKRGEDLTIKKYKDIAEWANDGGEEYNYIFINGIWYCDEEDSAGIDLALKLLNEKNKLDKVLENDKVAER